MEPILNNILCLEALIFAADSPISADDLQACMEKYLQSSYSTQDFEYDLAQLIEKYEQPTSALCLKQIAGGFAFMTKPDFQPLLLQLLQQNAKKRLSTTALETLAIIAYKQPIAKSEIEQIRGVNADYAIQKLLERDLIEIKGRSEQPGRPSLYGTSGFFMDYFGINSLKDLPQLKDIAPEVNAIGLQEEAPTIADEGQ